MRPGYLEQVLRNYRTIQKRRCPSTDVIFIKIGQCFWVADKLEDICK
jgi:hypothetical protein